MTAGAAASRYARALFDVVLKESHDVAKVQGEVQQFADLFATPQLAHILGNPGIPASRDIPEQPSCPTEPGFP